MEGGALGKMKKGLSMRLIPIYIMTFVLFSLAGAGTTAVLIISKADLSVLCWFIPALALICIAFAVCTMWFFKRIKKSYDASFKQILTAFSPDQAEALMSVNDGEPTPEQLSRWVCEQTEESHRAADLMAIISAQQELSDEIFWQLTDNSAKMVFGSYWSHTYGYNHLDRSSNIRNLFTDDTKVDFDRALRSFKDGTAKSFKITGELKLNPQKTVKVIIKGSPVEDEKHGLTAVGTVHDIQEETNLISRIQIDKIKEQFLLSGETDIIYEVDVPDNKLICLNPETSNQMLGFGHMLDFDGERRPYWEQIHPDYREGFIDRFFDYNHMMIMPEHKMTYQYKIKDKNGDYTWVEHQAQVTSSHHGTVTGVIGRVGNINKQKTEELKVRYQTKNDSLTGAYLRSAVENKFNSHLSDGKPRAVVIFNINKFHFINNEYGFEYGDKVLKHFVGTLWDRQRGICYVGRVDNDTFVIAMHEADNRKDWAQNQILSVLEAFAQPVKVEGRLVNITVTAGGSQAVPNKDFNALYAQAETALEKCRKANGKFENAYELFSEDANEQDNEQADEQADKQANEQGDEQANQQVDKQA